MIPFLLLRRITRPRFTLRDGRTLDIWIPYSGPVVLTLDGAEIAMIERQAMQEWNNIRLYDGSWLQVRSVRDTWGLHFDVAVDQQRVPGSWRTVDWQLRILSFLVGFEAVLYTVSGAVSAVGAFFGRGSVDNLVIGITLFLVAIAVRQRSRLAVWAAVAWFGWTFARYEYDQLSHGSFTVELLSATTLYFAWRSLKALYGKDPELEPLAP